jgi:hypothetical protein
VGGIGGIGGIGEMLDVMGVWIRYTGVTYSYWHGEGTYESPIVHIPKVYFLESHTQS